jgi:hypothetical protein
LQVPLSFLDDGRRYYATIYRDGKDAGFAGIRIVEIETRESARRHAGTEARARGRAGRALLDASAPGQR